MCSVLLLKHIWYFYLFLSLSVYWSSVSLTLPYASLCNSHFSLFFLFLDCWYIHVHELYQSSYMYCEWVMYAMYICLFRYMSFLLRWVFPCRCDLPLRCGELNCLVTTSCISLESSLAFLLITIFSFYIHSFCDCLCFVSMEDSCTGDYVLFSLAFKSLWDMLLMHSSQLFVGLSGNVHGFFFF